MNFNNILFLDIETVSQYETYENLPGDWRELWDIKAQLIMRNKETETSENIYDRAGIYAEFGKIICISCGCIQGTGEDKKLRIKSFCDPDEKKLLSDFADMLASWADNNKFLCAHNGKEFDYPYICRRMIINGVTIPDAMQIVGKKPWDVKQLDTMELWKFGDYKSYTSLKLLAKVLGVPSPKDDIDGSMVYSVYWMEKDLERIITYCQKDVITLTQVYLRLYNEPLVKKENIEVKEVRKADV
jgi:3'-5' exonuclease